MVHPVRIVEHADHEALLGGGGQHGQRRHSHEERLDSGSIVLAEGHRQGSRLRCRELFAQPREGSQQLVQGRERQRRLDLDTARDQVQATVTQAWGQLEAAKASITATQAQVAASEIALNGVREEARVGQRTTLDVLNATQDLLNARVALVTAQRDRVVASYTVLAAVGSLSPQILGLGIQVYDPMVHYQQVRDAWAGVRVPDGR